VVCGGRGAQVVSGQTQTTGTANRELLDDGAEGGMSPLHQGGDTGISSALFPAVTLSLERGLACSRRLTNVPACSRRSPLLCECLIILLYVYKNLILGEWYWALPLEPHQFYCLCVYIYIYLIAVKRAH
jgi:hypothetical protein